jgi:copper chaperone CopZ
MSPDDRIAFVPTLWASMHAHRTAIIHLREPVLPTFAGLIEPLLVKLSGVEAAHVVPVDQMISVRFDQVRINLADIVRVIEDAGSPIAGVAERHA